MLFTYHELLLISRTWVTCTLSIYANIHLSIWNIGCFCTELLYGVSKFQFNVDHTVTYDIVLL